MYPYCSTHTGTREILLLQKPKFLFESKLNWYIFHFLQCKLRASQGQFNTLNKMVYFFKENSLDSFKEIDQKHYDRVDLISRLKNQRQRKKKKTLDYTGCWMKREHSCFKHRQLSEQPLWKKSGWLDSRLLADCQTIILGHLWLPINWQSTNNRLKGKTIVIPAHISKTAASIEKNNGISSPPTYIDT